MRWMLRFSIYKIEWPRDIYQYAKEMLIVINTDSKIQENRILHHYFFP
jgi:hypothetical protein